MNIPIPTKIGSKMGGEFTHPKMVSSHNQVRQAVPPESGIVDRLRADCTQTVVELDRKKVAGGTNQNRSKKNTGKRHHAQGESTRKLQKTMVD